MYLDERIYSFAALGDRIRTFTGNRDGHVDSSRLTIAVDRAEKENPWFTRDFIMHAFGYWGSVLRKETLMDWLRPYCPASGKPDIPLRVGIIMAGNIPMVGFHDLLCTLITGNIAIARLSSKDASLIPGLIGILSELNPGWNDLVELTSSEIERPDIIIATGSNNTSRYFHHYFGKYPHIIRKSRTGIAVLDGMESENELLGLASDIFNYFGLGCRNVSKLFLPASYDFRNLHEAMASWCSISKHNGYRNNLDYYKAIFLVNRTPFLDGGFYLMAENELSLTPVSVIYYEYYKDFSDLRNKMDTQSDQIQCTVARAGLIPGAITPGKSQYPGLGDYADGVDTLAFLLEKI